MTKINFNTANYANIAQYFNDTTNISKHAVLGLLSDNDVQEEWQSADLYSIDTAHANTINALHNKHALTDRHTSTSNEFNALISDIENNYSDLANYINTMLANADFVENVEQYCGL